MKHIIIEESELGQLDLLGIEYKEEILPEVTEHDLSPLREFKTFSKVNITEFVKDTIEPIKNGLKSALEVKVLSKALKEVQKLLDSEINEFAIDEFEKYPEKKVNLQGFEITKKQRTTYDYSNSDYIMDLEYQIKNLQDIKKEAEKIALASKIPIPFSHHETGEQVILNPPIPSTIEFLNLTYEKSRD